MPSLRLPPPDRIVFGDWQHRTRDHTTAPIYGPYERLWRCDQHQVTWRGYGRCWMGGTECTPTALW